MQIVQAPTNSWLADTDTVVTQTVASQLKNSGLHALIRYIPHLGNHGTGDISQQELEVILSAGLAFMPVQHVRPSGWQPTPNMGMGDAAWAINYMHKIGLPKGISVWSDMEGIGGGDSIGYENAWAKEIKDAGYIPGTYVGPGWNITPYQLYHDLTVRAYWQSASSSAPIPEIRGSQMFQHLPSKEAGIWIDKDGIIEDSLGGLPIWLTA